MQFLHGAGASGNHFKLGIEPLKVQLAHHRVMSLLDEELPRAGLELFFDELELPLREPESLDVFGRIRIGVRKENLGRGLFYNRSTDGTVKHIARALRC